jgi:hypothetical protein
MKYVHTPRFRHTPVFTQTLTRVIYRSCPTFLRYIDPTLEHDLTSQAKPWALSPLISTMPYFSHRRLGESDTPPEFPPRESLRDDISQLAEAIEDPTERDRALSHLAKIKTADQRRAHFANREARKSIPLGPNVGSASCHDILPVFHRTTLLTDLLLWAPLTLGSHYDRFLLWFS